MVFPLILLCVQALPYLFAGLVACVQALPLLIQLCQCVGMCLGNPEGACLALAYVVCLPILLPFWLVSSCSRLAYRACEPGLREPLPDGVLEVHVGRRAPPDLCSGDDLAANMSIGRCLCWPCAPTVVFVPDQHLERLKSVWGDNAADVLLPLEACMVELGNELGDDVLDRRLVLAGMRRWVGSDAARRLQRSLEATRVQLIDTEPFAIRITLADPVLKDASAAPGEGASQWEEALPAAPPTVEVASPLHPMQTSAAGADAARRLRVGRVLLAASRSPALAGGTAPSEGAAPSPTELPHLRAAVGSPLTRADV